MCNTKQKVGGVYLSRSGAAEAEQSAAAMALASIKQDPELMKESEKPKGAGKGEKAGVLRRL